MRRARRILPAALVALLAISALTLALVPQREWADWFREIVASTLYYENWQLAIDSQTPKRADLESTPVQHFWSLSVEEQFYLFWPLLHDHRALARAPVAELDRRASCSPCSAPSPCCRSCTRVMLTAQDVNLAYFSTFSRTWEFGVGGILAIVATPPVDRPRRPARGRVVDRPGAHHRADRVVPRRPTCSRASSCSCRSSAPWR